VLGAILAESLLAFAAGSLCPRQRPAVQSDTDFPVGGGPVAALPNWKDTMMDDEQRTKAANAQDPKQAGRIVRSLKQIEDDYHLASGALSGRMMLAAVQAIKQAVPEPLKVVESDVTAAIHSIDWKATRGVGQDVAIELGELCAEEDREYCWLAAATAAGPTRLGLELVFRPGLRETATTIIRNDKQMGAIWKAGWLRDETEARLFIPIVVPAETLAQAFEQNSLDVAMAPVTKAVEQAIAAKAELDKIVEAVRIAAKVTK
jgi:hypothetical protein